METGKNTLQILLLILVVAVMFLVIMYFQQKSSSNSYNHPVRPLTIEEKARFKGGLDASS